MWSTCAVGEYSKVFDWKSVTIPVLSTLIFKQLKDGEMKSVSTFSKMSLPTLWRGWIFTENIQTIFSIASFDLDGYHLYSHENDKYGIFKGRNIDDMNFNYLTVAFL